MPFAGPHHLLLHFNIFFDQNIAKIEKTINMLHTKIQRFSYVTDLRHIFKQHKCFQISGETLRGFPRNQNDPLNCSWETLVRWKGEGGWGHGF